MDPAGSGWPTDSEGAGWSGAELLWRWEEERKMEEGADMWARMVREREGGRGRTALGKERLTGGACSSAEQRECGLRWAEDWAAGAGGGGPRAR